MSEGIKIESDRRTVVEAETIKEAFLGQGFITSMRFSELNGPEEYDNTHLYIDWRACFAHGLTTPIFEWREYIERVKNDTKEWAEVPTVQKDAIERTIKEIDAYDKTKPMDDEGNLWVIRNKLMKYSTDLTVGVLTYDGQLGIINGRMARDKGHKKDLLKVTENRKERDKEIEIEGQQKHFWNR